MCCTRSCNTELASVRIRLINVCPSEAAFCSPVVPVRYHRRPRLVSMYNVTTYYPEGFPVEKSPCRYVDSIAMLPDLPQLNHRPLTPPKRSLNSNVELHSFRVSIHLCIPRHRDRRCVSPRRIDSPHAERSKLSITPCALSRLTLLPCLLWPRVGVVGRDRFGPA